MFHMESDCGIMESGVLELINDPRIAYKKLLKYFDDVEKRTMRKDGLHG